LLENHLDSAAIDFNKKIMFTSVFFSMASLLDCFNALLGKIREPKQRFFCIFPYIDKEVFAEVENRPPYCGPTTGRWISGNWTAAGGKV